MTHVEVVVACYKDDLFWIHNISPNVTVYYKDPSHPDYDEKFALPNVGREAHTWVHHIITRYDTLAPYTMFLQGNPLDHCSPRDVASVALRGIVDQFDTLGDMWIVDQMGRPLNDWNCDLNHVWQQLFVSPLPQRIICARGAQFVASKELIHGRSIEFWQKCLTICEEWKDAAHAFECLWGLVLDLRYRDVTQ